MTAHHGLDEPGGPEHYPWTGLHGAPSLLLSTGIRALGRTAGSRDVDAALITDGAAPLSDRTLVLAVGSNRSPAVIARKYRRAGHEGPVATPFLGCTVGELAVGHSAHVSARGYIAAAPHRAPGAVTELVATWFDEEQLEIVDRSEPGYERIELSGEEFPLELATGARPDRFSVYASRWGVIADGPPLAFRARQQDLFGLLGVLTGADAFAGDAAEVCARLAWEPERVGEVLREQALIVPDGLPRPLTPR